MKNTYHFQTILKPKERMKVSMVIIMLGAPGTGKGTIAGILSGKLRIPQVSTGDIFRKHIKEQTELGKLADKYISKGDLVPDEVTINLVKDRLNDADVQKGIILDGFPRTVKQAEELDKILETKGRKVDLVINLHTPEKEIISVQYYNVIFYMIFRRGIDTLKQSALSGWIKSGSNIRMKDIYGWCTAQDIPVVMKFKYRKDFPIKANLWNFISYCRFRWDMKK